jgi:hypothetical protein
MLLRQSSDSEKSRYPPWLLIFHFVTCTAYVTDPSCLASTLPRLEPLPGTHSHAGDITNLDGTKPHPRRYGGSARVSQAAPA